MALHPPLKRKKNPQGPATSFVVACAFATVAGALGYKGRLLVVCTHGDTRAKFLRMTPGRKIVANLLKQLAKLVYHRASP